MSNVEIKTEHVDIGGSSVLLVSVKGGKGAIGCCSVGHNFQRGDSSKLNRVFYIGTDPVVNLVCPNNGDKRTDRIISMSTGYEGMAPDMHSAFTEMLNKLNRGDSLENGLRELFTLMSDGVYTVYASEYYPTDGAGTYFWGAYNIPHEVHGTAEHNRVIGKDRPYRPCFLIPGNTLDIYTQKKRDISDVAVKSRKYQGIVYHLSGLHSVLLKGHHGAVSCTAQDIPFKCAVIEKITDMYTVPFAAAPAPVPAPAPAEGETPAEENAAEATPAPAPVSAEQREGITGFRSASVKIPIELMPKEMLRILLENRFEYKPSHYANIVHKMKMVRRKTLTNNTLAKNIHDRCELMPDCEMIESAFAVDSLSEEQLQALLSGDTEFDGKVIISPNFYSSVVTACNYLQFHDEKRFVEFAIAIMDNPDLFATHEYIANRISRLDNSKVYSFFKGALASGEEKYAKILEIADKYVKTYDVRH